MYLGKVCMVRVTSSWGFVWWNMSMSVVEEEDHYIQALRVLIYACDTL
jgi:hypothetical protein